MSIATWRIRKELLWSGYVPNWKMEEGCTHTTPATAEVEQPILLESELILPILLIFTQQTEEHEQVV